MPKDQPYVFVDEWIDSVRRYFTTLSVIDGVGELYDEIEMARLMQCFLKYKIHHGKELTQVFAICLTLVGRAEMCLHHTEQLPLSFLAW